MSGLVREAPAKRFPRVSAIAGLLAAGAMLGLPAAAGAALVPHFSALPASGNTEMSLARDGSGAAALPGGKALIVGGFNGGGPQTTAEIFDSATDTFTTLGTHLQTARSGAAVAPLPGGRALIAGGATSGSTVLQSAETFDEATGAFTTLPASGSTELSVSRTAAAAAPLPDGRVLIVGGFNGTYLQSAELFDPASGTFTPLPASGNAELQTARDYPAAVPLPGGKVLIAGGSGVAGVLASAEIFDPATETFSALPASGVTELQTARTAPAAGALTDGRVLIVGGDTSASGSVTDADVLSSAEVFDPASGTFTALPASGATQLQNPRAYTAATALGNGQILIAGGAGPGYLASAELATLPPSCSPSSASLAAGATDGQVTLHCSGFSFAYSIVSSPSHGSLGAVDQAHGTLTYTSRAGFSGRDSFTYEAMNVAGASAPATVTITVPGPPPPPPSTSVGRISVRGAAASLRITCHGASAATCTGTARFTTRLATRGSVPVRVAAPADARLKHKTKTKTKTKTVTVATASFSLPTGPTATVPVKLDATGKRLLSRFYKLPTLMTLTGTASLTRAVQFRYSVIDASVNDRFTYSASGLTVVSRLTPTTLPHGSLVKLSCRGRGCPFTKRVLAGRSGSLPLAGQFRGAQLRPGTVVQLTVTAPVSVGQVNIYTMVRKGLPKLAVRCLPPGARRPVVCA